MRPGAFQGYTLPQIAPAGGLAKAGVQDFPLAAKSPRSRKVAFVALKTGLKRGGQPSARFAAVAVAALGLSACSSLDTRQNVGPCPVAASLYEASRLVEVGEVERHENVAFTGSIEGVRSFCRYVDKNPITMELEIDFALGRGPQAEGDSKTYQYFVAVTRRDRLVIAKETFPLQVDFRRGAQVVRVTEKVGGIVIPRATETVSGTNFEVIVGFELTPDQLAFNRAGKRFRMQTE